MMFLRLYWLCNLQRGLLTFSVSGGGGGGGGGSDTDVLLSWAGDSGSGGDHNSFSVWDVMARVLKFKVRRCCCCCYRRLALTLRRRALLLLPVLPARGDHHVAGATPAAARNRRRVCRVQQHGPQGAGVACDQNHFVTPATATERGRLDGAGATGQRGCRPAEESPGAAGGAQTRHSLAGVRTRQQRTAWSGVRL